VRFYVLSMPHPWEHINKPVPFAGQSTELYQKTLEATIEHAKVAEDYGFEGIFFSEQHGDIEGSLEVTSNPILLDLLIATHTERIMVGQLGNVLPVANPLLVADQLAQLDQMTKGRVLAGFTRGNSPRWVDSFGQQIGMRATRSDKSEADERNLRALIEAWEVIKLAWTQDTFSFKGEFWEFPAPGTKWSYPPTKEWGKGVDADDNQLELGIAPKPYQSPHPRIFAPMSGRATTQKFWATQGATCVSLAPNMDLNKGLLNIYHQHAEQEGRHPKRGDGLIVGGSYTIASTEAEAKRRTEEWKAWDEKYFGCPPFNLPHPINFNGTPDQIVEQIGAMHEDLGVEEFIIMDYYGAPHGYEVSLEMLHLFGSEVLPQLDGVSTDPGSAYRDRVAETV
jgi:alkanesulfonate monooxygenase SsuD/methylene tetrahydromethanopterin reductase-like flavin-dependent oxidoreductase (luciferase family)